MFHLIFIVILYHFIKKMISFLIYCNIFVIQMQQKNILKITKLNSNCYFIYIFCENLKINIYK